jgi:hypothetical protein
MLEARLLTKYFNRKPVVKDASFTIRQNAMKYPVSEYCNPGLERKGSGFKQPFGYGNKRVTLLN